MSGAEAIALIGIISSTLQLLDFSCKLLTGIKEVKEDGTSLPKTFWRLHSQLPLIAHALQITWEQVQSDQLNEELCKAIFPIISDCEAGVDQLNKKLGKLTTTIADTAWKRNLKVMASIFQEKEIASIAEALSRSLVVINQYHGAYTAATTGTILRKLTAAVEAIPGKADSHETIPSRHFMVSTIWIDDFTGRQETITHIENLMSDEGKHRRIAIMGLGGVGKTRVMLQYAYQFKESETHSVFWIHASSLPRVNKTCLEIAKTLKLSGCDDPKSDKLKLICEWLESPRAGKWRLLLDNADDFDLLYGSGKLVKSLPRSENGAILLTTRNARIGKEFAKLQSFTLGALSEKESIELLNTRLGAGDKDYNDLSELSKELYGIPLALVQASSFISQNYLSIPSYLELYRASDFDKIELLSEDFSDEIRDPESRNPIATTWSVSFDHIHDWDPLAADILSVMSMLDPQAIPESLVYFTDSRTKFSKSIATLQSFSLITARTDGPTWEGRREKSFDLHRLVRLAMRSWLSHRGEFESQTAKALATMATNFTNCEWETKEKWVSYLPHAAVLLASDHLNGLENLVLSQASLHERNFGTVGHIAEGVVCPVCAAALLTILSSCHFLIGFRLLSFEEAEKAYRLNKNSLGETHLNTLTTLDLIAKAAKCLYKFPRAVEVSQLAIKGKSKLLGPNHPSTLQSMATLGTIYRPMDKVQEAKDIGIQVLEKRRQILGNSHPETLNSMTYVSTAIRVLGDYKGAVKLESQNLQDRQKLYGPSHPQSLESMACLAWAYACQGNYDQASQFMSRSIHLQFEIRGPRHTYTLWTMSNMAVILGMQGKYSEAEELCERCLSLRTQYEGISHPFRYVSKLYLAWLYNETGRFLEAEAIELEVLDFQRGFYGEETNHDVLLTKSQLASTYSFIGRHVDAEVIKTEVLNARLKLKGDNHPSTMRCKSSLGMTLAELGRLSEAERLLIDAYVAQKRNLGVDHPETITTLSRMGKLFKDQGRSTKAESSCRKAAQASVKALGGSHPRSMARTRDVAQFEIKLKKSEISPSMEPANSVQMLSHDVEGLNIGD